MENKLIFDVIYIFSAYCLLLIFLFWEEKGNSWYALLVRQKQQEYITLDLKCRFAYMTKNWKEWQDAASQGFGLHYANEKSDGPQCLSWVFSSLRMPVYFVVIQLRSWLFANFILVNQHSMQQLYWEEHYS